MSSERGERRTSVLGGIEAAPMFIGGVWRTRSSSFEVMNPATGEVISRQALADEEDAKEAVEAAAGALDRWRKTPAFERARILERVSRLLVERAEVIGEVLALESGKLLGEAVGEVHFAADYFRWFSGEARRLQRFTCVEGRDGGPQMILRKPAGVAACLTPWNFPVSIQARKIAPALAAGCTVVARPSEEAPNSVVKLFGCLEEAGFPEGVANLLTGPAEEITRPMLEDPRVRVLSFTGSTSVGKKLYERSAATTKRLALELGGCAPFIVLEDADLGLAVEQAMVSKFRNCGQSCVAANVFYVHDRCYEEFISGLGERINDLRLGDPLREETTLGPLINVERRRAVEEIRDRALERGFARVAAARMPSRQDGIYPECFFPAELLVSRDYRDTDQHLLRTEIFGPLALVVGFSDLSELIGHLKQNPLGLAAYVFSHDETKALRVASSLEVGIAGVNEGLASAANVPMGGVKDSGIGREGGHEGLEEFLEYQYIATRDLRFIGNPHPD
ncbi:NAD-dependent succinate-semialdehyde dehydrogenase [Rubrobacter calidifluminis]|uniref:NAD-dependent succinate-semialdehyde dehydrogenase n=1 Tax=Rubrobacter calidifluminis TaxID=1392640 RepID=UPI0023600059|nr:NAD-dependent succinate-semialdehyde dehydrogenase [Rubrobacter calidifluminis]